MKKLFTILLIGFIAASSFSQPPPITCLHLAQDPTNNENTQYAVDALTALGIQVTVEVISPTSAVSGYDFVVIGENVGSTQVDQARYSTAPLPILVWKPHNVRPGGLSWAPDRGDNTPDSVILIEKDHEVLLGLPTDEIQICSGLDYTSNEDGCGYVEIPPVPGYEVIGENADADPGHHTVALIDPGTTLEGNLLENKAAIFVLSARGFSLLTEDGKRLLKNICNWLVDRPLTGLEDISQQNSSDQVSVYPSPSSGMVNVKFDQMLSGPVIKVLSIDGRVLFSKQYHNTSFEELDLSGLHSGIYLIHVKGSDFSYTKRLIMNK
jgi:hypothetical protein